MELFSEDVLKRKLAYVISKYTNCLSFVFRNFVIVLLGEFKISVVIKIYKNLRLDFLLSIYHIATVVSYGPTWCKIRFNKRIRLYLNVQNIKCKNTCFLSSLSCITLLLLNSMIFFMWKPIWIPSIYLFPVTLSILPFMNYEVRHCTELRIIFLSL